MPQYTVVLRVRHEDGEEETFHWNRNWALTKRKAIKKAIRWVKGCYMRSRLPVPEIFLRDIYRFDSYPHLRITHLADEALRELTSKL